MAYLILLMLSIEPMHGYELMKRLRGLLEKASLGRPGPGTIYPLLKRLESEGLVEATRSSRGGKELIVYHVTSKGVERLMEMALQGLRIVDLVLDLHEEALKSLRSRGVRVSSKEQLDSLRSLLERIAEKTSRIARMLS